ncbi:MAG: hypothetical protein ACTH21_08580 [Lactococcus lactis]
MAITDEKLNVRAEIEQAVAKECSFTEFNPVFEDLFFSLNWLEERDCQGPSKNVGFGSLKM